MVILLLCFVSLFPFSIIPYDWRWLMLKCWFQIWGQFRGHQQKLKFKSDVHILFHCSKFEYCCKQLTGSKTKTGELYLTVALNDPVLTQSVEWTKTTTFKIGLFCGQQPRNKHRHRGSWVFISFNIWNQPRAAAAETLNIRCNVHGRCSDSHEHTNIIRTGPVQRS